MQQFRWVGRPIPRLDALDKAVGRTKYPSDYYMDNMLWGKVLRSKYPHAKILSIDVSKALKHPGVVAVFTHKDIPNNRFGLFHKDRPVLCDDKVRYIGDPVALVAAETPEAAEDAANLIDVRYEPLPVVDDVFKAVEGDGAKVHERGNVARQTRITFGDVEEAFDNAEVIVENTYRTGAQIHAYLETEAGLSYIDEKGRITIVSCGQSPYRDKKEICETLALPEEKVRVIIPPVGGAFGGKDDISVQIFLALITLKTGRPAKMFLSREESTISSTKRHMAYITMKTAADKNGKLLANQTEIILDTGAYEGLGPAVLDVAIENCNGPYKIPNIDIKAKLVYTNNYFASAFRGFGAPQVMFAIESQVDAIAEKLGLDPIEIRLRNVVRRGDYGVFRNKIEGSVGIADALEKARMHELWLRRDDIRKTRHRPWIRQGVGVAAAVKGYTIGALPDKGVVGIELTTDGRFIIKLSSTEIGQGVVAAIAQIAADMLSCHLKNIEIKAADTSQTPDTSVTSASRQLYLAGNALRKASEEMIKKLITAFSIATGEPAYNASVSDGYVASTSTGRRLSYSEAARILEEKGIGREAFGEYEVPRTTPIPGTLEIPHLFYMYAAAIAHVEVNILTGVVKVKKLVLLPDAGRVINPQTFTGQVEGAAAQGIGYAVLEDAKIEQGILRTINLSTYLIPSIKDAPAMEVIPIETTEDTGPLGAKGVGEIGIIPVAPAVANAIKHATGVRVLEVPITPERLYRRLKEAGQNTPR